MFLQFPSVRRTLLVCAHCVLRGLLSLVRLKRHQGILVDLSQIGSFRAHVDVICHRVGVTAADCIFLLVLLKIGLEDGLGALKTLLVAPLVLFSFKNIT